MGPFDLTGRAVVVTGGTRGIGLAMAHALAAAGADVAVWGRDPAAGAAAVEELSRHGRRTLAVPCDVGQEDQVDEAMDVTVAALGPVRACFANAGVAGSSRSFLDLSAEEWRRVTATNLDGTFLTLRAAARQMVGSGLGGSLVAISSIAVVHGLARNQHYAASKAGIVAMVRGIAVELARHGIRANVVIPGTTESDMVGELLASERFREAVLPRVPLGRWGRGEDLGGIAVYLASDASSYHTGDAIVVDGGYTIA